MTAPILHIGGDLADRALVRRVLEEAGHDVQEVATGAAAMAEVRRRPPALILLELDLPDDDGYETATRLRSRPELADVRIVTLAPRGERDLALSLGCDGFLEQPLDPERLPKQLRAFLRGKRQRVRPAVESRRLREYSAALVHKLEGKVRELTQANDRLRQLDEIKNHILENVSNELATPLTPILGYVEMLESGRLGPLDARQRKAVMGISSGVRRLGRTVDGLLDLASLEEVGAPVELRPFDLGHAAREAAQTLRPKSRSRYVEVEISDPRPVIALGEPAKIRQALVHLLDNALRFTPKGGHILVAITGEGEGCRAAIFDQGDPIPADEQARVFELFHPPGRRGTGGTTANLGLAVARRIAETHGGRLTVQSPPRVQPEADHQYGGACFVLELPGHQGD